MSDADRSLRRGCIGGSDARVIMSGDERAVHDLWLEKRGELAPVDLSGVLLVQLGNVLEPINIDWFEQETGFLVVGEQVRHTYEPWPVATCTVDGLVTDDPGNTPLGVFEAKFMLPFQFSVERALAKYRAQLEHNMMVAGFDRAWLSIINGGAQWHVVEIEADPFYQIALFEAERRFWDCVLTGKSPNAVDVVPPEASAEKPARIVSMQGSNMWAAHAADLIETRPYVDRHNEALKVIKAMMPSDARQASGHGLTLSRDKANKIRVRFDETSP